MKPKESEMKKPEFQNPNAMYGKTYHDKCCRAFGYNEACDDYEKFLPTEEEIEDICKRFKVSEVLGQRHKLAVAIHKRIKGE